MNNVCIMEQHEFTQEELWHWDEEEAKGNGIMLLKDVDATQCTKYPGFQINPNDYVRKFNVSNKYELEFCRKQVSWANRIFMPYGPYYTDKTIFETENEELANELGMKKNNGQNVYSIIMDVK